MMKTFSTIQEFRQGIELNLGLLTGTRIANLFWLEKRIILMLFVCFSLLT